MGYQARIDAHIGFRQDALLPVVSSLGEVLDTVQELRFRREVRSHRGLHRLKSLRRVWLYAVNQDCLEEVVQLPGVELLVMDGVTASDLSPLAAMRALRYLGVNGGTKVTSLYWVVDLPPLQSLALENFKRVVDLGPLSALTTLTALGFEGSIWMRMTPRTLAPLRGLRALQSLFLTNVLTKDRSLEPLQGLVALKTLDFGALFPDEELIQLWRALPNLKCSWFDMLDRYGSTRAGIRASVKKALK